MKVPHALPSSSDGYLCPRAQVSPCHLAPCLQALTKMGVRCWLGQGSCWLDARESWGTPSFALCRGMWPCRMRFLAGERPRCRAGTSLKARVAKSAWGKEAALGAAN